jgi:hypothetical protein
VHGNDGPRWLPDDYVARHIIAHDGGGDPAEKREGARVAGDPLGHLLPAATELGVVVNIPDLWIREVANHALALLLAWNRKIVALDREMRSGVRMSRVPGGVTGPLHGETVGVVGLGNMRQRLRAARGRLEMRVIACDPYVEPAKFAALNVERVSPTRSRRKRTTCRCTRS